jgi:hypothetical protein
VAFLAAESLYLGDSHPFDADVGERVFYFLEFEGLDDGDDELHEWEKSGVRRLALNAVVDTATIRLHRAGCSSMTAGLEACRAEKHPESNRAASFRKSRRESGSDCGT